VEVAMKNALQVQHTHSILAYLQIGWGGRVTGVFEQQSFDCVVMSSYITYELWS
jgi:hypothetical protein